MTQNNVDELDNIIMTQNNVDELDTKNDTRATWMNWTIQWHMKKHPKNIDKLSALSPGNQNGMKPFPCPICVNMFVLTGVLDRDN